MKKNRLFRAIYRLFRDYIMPPLRSALRAGAALTRDVLLAELQAMLQRLSSPVTLTSAVVIEA